MKSKVEYLTLLLHQREDQSILVTIFVSRFKYNCALGLNPICLQFWFLFNPPQVVTASVYVITIFLHAQRTLNVVSFELRISLALLRPIYRITHHAWVVVAVIECDAFPSNFAVFVFLVFFGVSITALFL